MSPTRRLTNWPKSKNIMFINKLCAAIVMSTDSIMLVMTTSGVIALHEEIIEHFQ